MSAPINDLVRTAALRLARQEVQRAESVLDTDQDALFLISVLAESDEAERAANIIYHIAEASSAQRQLALLFKAGAHT